MDKLSLLVWLSRGSKIKLVYLMSKYTGCEPEVYTEKELIRLYEKAIIDISSKYHIKNLMYIYFDAKNRWQNYASMFPNRHTYSDLDALSAVILSILPATFDDEDLTKLKELKEKYLEEESE